MKTVQQSKGRLPYVAIRTFECFARRGDIGAASSELGVTPSAISHQLRSLEDFLGVPLTVRVGRRLRLTAEGRRYFEALRPGFQVLDDATGQLMREPQAPRILVSALPLIAVEWLIPALSGFMAAYASVQVQVQYARHRNYTSDEAEISLRFGQGPWPGYRNQLLLAGVVHPFATATLARRLATEADWRDLPLLHDGNPELWRSWFAIAKRPPPESLTGVVCEDGSLVRAAALAGLGAALLPTLLVTGDVEAGRLVRLSPQSLERGDGYHLCVREDRAEAKEVRQLTDWLVATSLRSAAVP